jgi:effector-binding domain-containing protein
MFHEHYTHQFFFEEGDLEILQPVCNADPQDPDVKSFGGFLLASLTHVGFYTELLPQYVTLIKWIEENGYLIDGDPLEMYLVEFTQGVNRNDYVTRIGFPVKRADS